MKESTERIPEEKSNKIVLNEKVQQEIISNSNFRRDNFLFKKDYQEKKYKNNISTRWRTTTPTKPF